MPGTTRSKAPTEKPSPAEQPMAANHVHLTGRLSAVDARTLPSGDEVVALRVVVPRARARRDGPTIDTIDCTVWRADLRRRVLGWELGQTVEIDGALRRRFWRAATGARSRYDVEVSRLRRVR
jgi:single-strand DNA-binding protein